MEFTKVAIVIARSPKPIAKVVEIKYPVAKRKVVSSAISTVKPPYENPNILYIYIYIYIWLSTHLL